MLFPKHVHEKRSGSLFADIGCVLVSCLLFRLQVLYSRDHLSSSLHGVSCKGILSMTKAGG